jgi:HK97 family phage prohead protease
MLLRDANTSESPIYVRLDPGSLDLESIKEEPRTIEVVASTQTLDSHGTILRQNWDLTRFEQNPVVLWAHDRVSLPIARATKVKTTGNKKNGKRLEATIQFPPEGDFDRSDEVWDAIRAGLVRGVSVGFQPHTTKFETDNDREIMVLDNNELLEISFVPVGSNPDALAKMRARMLAEREEPQQLLPLDSPERAAPEQKERTMPESNAEQFGAILETSKLEERFAVLTTDHQRLLAACGADTVEKALGFVEARKAESSQLEAIVSATGTDTVEKALGVIEAGKAAAESLKAAQAKITEQEKAAEDRERAEIVAKLESEKRITPALRDGFCKTATMEALRSFANDAPVIVAKSGNQEPSNGGNADDPAASAAGKNWSEMSNLERHALWESNPEAYEAAKPAHLKNRDRRLSRNRNNN